MISVESLKFELSGRLQDLVDVTGKTHLSVRWESRPQIVRLGACIEDYNWDSRMAVLERLVKFEADHADEFSLEFDIVPLDPVRDENFAEA